MRQALIPLLVLSFSVLSCEKKGGGRASGGAKTLAEARKEHKTEIVNLIRGNTPVPLPQEKTDQIYYDSPTGKLPAFVTPDPKDSRKHPLIIWLSGGFKNSIGDQAWTEGPPENEQSAAAYRKAGVVTMYPCLRGGNMDPGKIEAFYGEVEDVIAAAKAAEKISYVDPKHIYLGGHSTGGTLALLVAEMTDRFRGVFAFGPVDDVSGYAGSEKMPFNHHDAMEVRLRSPVHWMSSITSPTWIIEGDGQGNMAALENLDAADHPDSVRFVRVKGKDHFTVLAPLNTLIAKKILEDQKANRDKPCGITIKIGEWETAESAESSGTKPTEAGGAPGTDAPGTDAPGKTE